MGRKRLTITSSAHDPQSVRWIRHSRLTPTAVWWGQQPSQPAWWRARYYCLRWRRAWRRRPLPAGPQHHAPCRRMEGVYLYFSYITVLCNIYMIYGLTSFLIPFSLMSVCCSLHWQREGHRSPHTRIWFNFISSFFQSLLPYGLCNCIYVFRLISESSVCLHECVMQTSVYPSLSSGCQGLTCFPYLSWLSMTEKGSELDPILQVPA